MKTMIQSVTLSLTKAEARILLDAAQLGLDNADLIRIREDLSLLVIRLTNGLDDPGEIVVTNTIREQALTHLGMALEVLAEQVEDGDVVLDSDDLKDALVTLVSSGVFK